MRYFLKISFLIFLFVNDLCFSRGRDFDYLNEKLTIITTTSPIPSNPSTAILEKSMKSIYAIKDLRNCQKIIVFDGVKDANEHYHCRKSTEKILIDYEQYKRNVQALVDDPSNLYFKNIKLLFLDKFSHQAWALKAAMKLVLTPFIYCHQHDIEIIRPFDVVGIIKSMEINPNIKLVRACFGENHPSYFDGPLDDHINGNALVPLVRTFRFSDVDHFTTVQFYEEMVFPRVTSPNFAEIFVMEPDFVGMQNEMLRNHDQWGMYIYGRLGEKTTIKHLDGRERNG